MEVLGFACILAYSSSMIVGEGSSFDIYLLLDKFDSFYLILSVKATSLIFYESKRLTIDFNCIIIFFVLSNL